MYTIYLLSLCPDNVPVSQWDIKTGMQETTYTPLTLNFIHVMRVYSIRRWWHLQWQPLLDYIANNNFLRVRQRQVLVKSELTWVVRWWTEPQQRTRLTTFLFHFQSAILLCFIIGNGCGWRWHWNSESEIKRKVGNDHHSTSTWSSSSSSSSAGDDQMKMDHHRYTSPDLSLFLWIPPLQVIRRNLQIY